MRRTKKPAWVSAVEKCAGLARRIDDVVVGAVDQQKPQLVVIDGGIADRRGVEIDAPVLHRRRAEEFLDDLVVRTRGQIVRPLRVHVVDAIEADDGFDVGGNGGVGVVAIGAWYIGRRPAPPARQDGRRRNRR